MATIKHWGKKAIRIRSSTPYRHCISLTKDVVSKKTFLCIVILALVLCLLIYSHSTLTSGSGHHFLSHNMNWRHLVGNISEQSSDVSSNILNKIPFLSRFMDGSQGEVYKVDPDLPSETPFQSSTENLLGSIETRIQEYKVDPDLPSETPFQSPTENLLGSIETRIQELERVKSSLSENNQKYLIYLCDNTAWCGGWGDRQRGVVSLYLLSLAYNRSFGIRMTSPCDISQFYEPNEIPWLVTDADLKNKTTRVIYSIDSDPSKLDGKDSLKEDVVYIQTNMDTIREVREQFKNKMPKFVLNKNRPAIFRRVWKQLMKPTLRLQKRLDDLIYSGSTDGSLVCAHVRIGYSKYLRNDPPRLQLDSVETVWKFMEKFKKVRKYFVATDNDDVRKLARERFGNLYVDTGGTILHIDRQRKKDEACEGFETAILDQLILTKCDILVVSASNFSIRGAMLKTILRGIYMFDGKNIEAYSPMNHFRYRRHVGSHLGIYKSPQVLRVGKKLVKIHILPS